MSETIHRAVFDSLNTGLVYAGYVLPVVVVVLFVVWRSSR